MEISLFIAYHKSDSQCIIIYIIVVAIVLFLFIFS